MSGFPWFTPKRVVGTDLYPIGVTTESQVSNSFDSDDLKGKHTRDGRRESKSDRREGERNVYTAVYLTALQSQHALNTNESTAA